MTSFWWIEGDRTDSMWYSKLGHNRHCGLLIHPTLWFLFLGHNSDHAFKRHLALQRRLSDKEIVLPQPTGTCLELKWAVLEDSLPPTTDKHSDDCRLFLHHKQASWETLSHNNPANSLLDLWYTDTKWDNKCSLSQNYCSVLGKLLYSNKSLVKEDPTIKFLKLF